ncbi:survival of motor neuron-related-splicing factor 30 isoform X2 [Procambarus clarkii]|uniref:survival of motor neuron-related-splicing factor 30 isoform X2 n=1 Tax=Procambarus clarkii TaxID=6728 RepID=UPI001E674A74|nr:survival of motor neuron-related-splicing factor 30-like isoform X2 [Procambarus clarkii]XP_045580991.1 survival of motor neuron-related-splicing factor 30-like isoform X2 [Procambarus clarkii]
MAEDLSLQTYTVQLEQVEAALTSDPTNAELLKLKSDLQEVINLTKNLIDTQANSATSTSNLSSKESSSEPAPIRAWKVGDECMAIWSEDSQWYDAVIDAITDDGLVAVSFEGYGNSDVTKLSMLKERIPGEKRGQHHLGFASESEKNKRKLLEAQRQQAKKRKQRKHDRLKQIEEAHEADKAKWQAFSTKVRGTKKLKGVTKKSIFATPDAANGRVGIGTCGIGGKPMTEYTHAEKWRKGT